MTTIGSVEAQQLLPQLLGLFRVTATSTRLGGLSDSRIWRQRR